MANFKKYNRQEILDYIIAFKRDFDGCSPTIREIMIDCNVSSTSAVIYVLEDLQRAGHIKIHRGTNRSIMVVGGSWNFEQPNRI